MEILALHADVITGERLNCFIRDQLLPKVEGKSVILYGMTLSTSLSKPNAYMNQAMRENGEREKQENENPIL